MKGMPENDYNDEVLYRLGLVKENVEKEMSKRIKEKLDDILVYYDNEFAIDASLNPYPFWFFGEKTTIWRDLVTYDISVTDECNQWTADEFGYVGLDMLYRTMLATIETFDTEFYKRLSK